MRTHDGARVITLQPTCTNSRLQRQGDKHVCPTCGYWQWADSPLQPNTITAEHRIG